MTRLRPHLTAIGIALALVGFAVLVWHRRWICDDGLIFVRAVRQLLAGNGPNYNAFERIETSTSTLWTYLLAAAGWISGASISRLAVGLGGVAAVAGVALALDGTRRWHRGRGEARPLAPFGILLVFAVSAYWNFATSGLESGLSIGWIGLAWWLLVALHEVAPRRFQLVAAFVFGLGPLVRPDFGIITIAFLIALAALVRPRLRAALALAAVAFALPAAYEVFRAGYYGLLVPLPALAKSATHAEWARGLGYLLNFLGAYFLWLPLIGFVLVLGGMIAAGARRDRVLVATPVITGLVMTLYIVRVGGDFMHARMMLPATFVLLLPAALLPVDRRSALLVAVFVAWALWIGIRPATSRRVSAFGIEDEWAGYVRWTKTKHPIDPEPFIEADRPNSTYMIDALNAGRRRLMTEDHDLDVPLRPDLAAPGVYAAGRLGTGGAVAPLDAIAADTLGLANAIGARITKTQPGLPGHEKALPRAWLVADFGDPDNLTGTVPVTKVAVMAARHAMQCGEIAELLASVRAPMTPRRFWDNLVGAVRRTRLVIPADPLDAELAFCGGGPRVEVSSSYSREGWDPTWAVDGDRTSRPGAVGFSSFVPNPAQHTEWIAVRAPSGTASQVTLTPVMGGGLGFPLDFEVQIWNGTAWVTRATRTHEPIPTEPLTITWSPADKTDRVRIYATGLRKVAGDYVLQFAEVEAGP